MVNYIFRKTNKTGFGTIEIFISVAIIALSFFALSSVFQSALRLSNENMKSLQANFLAEEGIEAVKTIRSDGWSNISSLTSGNDYHLLFSGGVWILTAVPQYVDGIFERKIVFEDVYRDSNDDIAVSGTFDTGTKKVIVTVSWTANNKTSSVLVATYITELF